MHFKDRLYFAYVELKGYLLFNPIMIRNDECKLISKYIYDIRITSLSIVAEEAGVFCSK